MKKVSPKLGLFLYIFKNLPKINNRTVGEKSSNLVTLQSTHYFSHSVKFGSAPGWPDWANFRLLGNSLIWAVFRKYRSMWTRFGATLFLGKLSAWLILSKNVLGDILGDFLLPHLVTLFSCVADFFSKRNATC
jgi:hypothetical protein